MEKKTLAQQDTDNHGHALCSNICFQISAQCASHNYTISTAKYNLVSEALCRVIFPHILLLTQFDLRYFLCWRGTLDFPCCDWIVCACASGQSRVHLEQSSTHTGFQQGIPLPSQRLEKTNQALYWNNAPSHILTVSERKLLSVAHHYFNHPFLFQLRNAWWQAPT